ncbi:hypothetical protein [Pedobacter antarcticus]|uniref:hypothetical protein n=1 Tax=Pedobacter antarcticus TaxID=34086 RepID=UPI00292CB562|nr:hypothetical protein [Pedobacter antarcticus]
MEKLSYVDQAVNSDTFQFITVSGGVIDVKESDLLDFIEENSLNVSTGGTGLTSDPCGIEYELITDASVYLDNNFDDVTNDYFNSILINNLLKHVA